MEQNATEIFQEAMKLLPEGRAALAGSLLESLDDTVDESAEAAWEAEILRRLQDIDEGKVKLMSWAEARRRISGD
jgi:putative addiction module component (TIGR02574 family)